MLTNRLSDRDIFAKRLRLEICKPTRLHHCFLLQYNNNNKYLRTS